MLSISSISAGAALPPPSAAKAEALPQREEPQAAPRRPSMDEYVPEKAADTLQVNTDRVDREIQRLRNERDELNQQLRSETDPDKAQALEQKLCQVEEELRQKDNDAYRRQHAVFS